MKVTKSLAQDLLNLKVGGCTTEWECDLFGNNPILNLELVKSDLVGTRRWSHVYCRVYKDLSTGKFWETQYSTGATECQDEAPYEYDGDEVEFAEVEPVEVKTITYKAVK